MITATGYIRAIDSLGRVTIPSSLRLGNDMYVGDMVEFMTSPSGIVIRKYQQPGCQGCKSVDVKLYGELQLCESCIKSLNSELQGKKKKE